MVLNKKKCQHQTLKPFVEHDNVKKKIHPFLLLATVGDIKVCSKVYISKSGTQ